MAGHLNYFSLSALWGLEKKKIQLQLYQLPVDNTNVNRIILYLFLFEAFKNNHFFFIWSHILSTQVKKKKKFLQY